MRILVDSREQMPFSFTGMEKYMEGEGLEVITSTLPTGDYSLYGLEDKVAIERKSLSDLVLCLGRERDRFCRELERAAALDSFCVVIEANFPDLAKGEYRSRLNPHAGCQSIAAFMARYNIPFCFCGSRPAAEYVAFSYLWQYLQGARKRWKSILVAHGDITAA